VIYLALSPPESLILFVHGFRGKGTKTWGKAAGRLLADDRFAGCDLLFYDYSCRGRQVQRLALDIMGICDAAESNPVSIVANAGFTLVRKPDFRYKSLLLVCHSLGALLARRAMIDAVNSGQAWPGRTRLLLFAPAHMGARVKELLHMTLAPIPLPLEALFRTAYPCLSELEQDSTTLKALSAQTEQLLPRTPTMTAWGVVIADIEQVVETTPFLSDPPPFPPVDGTNHVSVCKADDGNQDPLERIAGCLTAP